MEDWGEWRVKAKEEGEKAARRLKIYLPIHILDASELPELLDRDYEFCKCMVIEEVEDEIGYKWRIAKCTVLDHYITRNQAKRCIRYWRQCPFRMKYCNEKKA